VRTSSIISFPSSRFCVDAFRSQWGTIALGSGALFQNMWGTIPVKWGNRIALPLQV